MKKNKKGWITILEVTISVLLISGVLMVVYVKQSSDESPVQDYIFSLQKQILSDIAIRSDLRILVLNENEEELNNFVGLRVPPAYRYSLKVCALENTADNCKLNTTEVIETLEKDVFAEEIVISSELGDGTNSIYEPMKVRLFIWENK